MGAFWSLLMAAGGETIYLCCCRFSWGKCFSCSLGFSHAFLNATLLLLAGDRSRFPQLTIFSLTGDRSCFPLLTLFSLAGARSRFPLLTLFLLAGARSRFPQLTLFSLAKARLKRIASRSGCVAARFALHFFKVVAASAPQCALDSAPLHLAHGLRPMKNHR